MIQLKASTRLMAATADTAQALHFVSQTAGIHVTTRDMMKSRGEVSFQLDEKKFNTALSNLRKHFGAPAKKQNPYTKGDIYTFDLGEGRTIKLAGGGEPHKSSDSSSDGKVLYFITLNDAAAAAD